MISSLAPHEVSINQKNSSLKILARRIFIKRPSSLFTQSNKFLLFQLNIFFKHKRLFGPLKRGLRVVQQWTCDDSQNFLIVPSGYAAVFLIWKWQLKSNVFIIVVKLMIFERARELSLSSDNFFEKQFNASGGMKIGISHNFSLLNKWCTVKIELNPAVNPLRTPSSHTKIFSHIFFFMNENECWSCQKSHLYSRRRSHSISTWLTSYYGISLMTSYCDDIMMRWWEWWWWCWQ